MKEILDRIQAKYDLQDTTSSSSSVVFTTVSKDLAIDMVTYMRDYEGFSHFVLMSCVDWVEDDKFQLLYLLNNPTLKRDLGIKVFIDRDNVSMQSAHHLWKQIWTYQRELKEAFGIDFPGSPRVDENFVLEGWTEIPHMRREFDTYKYSEETYFPRGNRRTNDPATHMKKKMYPNQPVTAKKNKDEE